MARVRLANLMTETERQRMKELCEAIAVEQDSGKMLRLVHELNVLLATKQERLDNMQAKAISFHRGNDHVVICSAMRHILEFPSRQNCQSYRCSECGWRYDVRRFSASIEVWFAQRNFEVHDCSAYMEKTLD